MKLLSAVILLIIFLKIVFVVCAVWMLVLKHENKEHSDLYSKLEYWKNRSEFAYVAFMSLILIQLFNPRNTKPINIGTEERRLLFLFGLILLVTANWGLFFKDARWYNIISGRG